MTTSEKIAAEWAARVRSFKSAATRLRNLTAKLAAGEVDVMTVYKARDAMERAQNRVDVMDLEKIAAEAYAAIAAIPAAREAGAAAVAAKRDAEVKKLREEEREIRNRLTPYR